MTAHPRHGTITVEFPAPLAPVHMAATLSWFLVQLVAQGHSLEAAQAALAQGVATQAEALAKSGLG